MRKFLSLFLVLFTLTFTFTLTCSAETLSDEILAQGKAEADLFLTLKQALGLDWIDEYNAYLGDPVTNPAPAWDTSVASLVSQGYLSSSFPTDFTIALTGQEVTISRTVSQAALREAMAIYLPAMTVSGDVVSLLVQRPAQWIAYETALNGKVSRDGSDNPDILPNSSLDFGSNSQINFVSGDGKILGVNSLFYKTQELDNRFVNITGDTMTGILTAAGFKVGSNNVWHQGNDGSGSGLDADLLDGQDSAFYRNASNINAGTLNSARLSGTYNISITGNAATATNANHANNADYATNAGNADTLDGKHESAFAPASHNHGQYVLKAGDTMTGNLSINHNNNPQIKINAPASGFVSSIELTEQTNNYGLRMFYDGRDSGDTAAANVIGGLENGIFNEVMRFKRQGGPVTFSNTPKVGTDTVWHAGNDGTGSGLDADLLDGQQGSFYQNASNINAGTLDSARLSGTYGISITGNAATATTASNSDQLDGYHHDAFVKRAGDTATGPIYFQGGLSAEAQVRDNITTRTPSGFWQTSSATTGEGWPQTASYYHLLTSTHSNTGNYYSMQFAGNFYNSSDIYYRATNGSGTTPWNKMWHSGNDGAGSGLDADLLDGQAGSFYQNASNLNTGVVPAARLSGTYGISITGNAATATNADTLDGYHHDAFVKRVGDTMTGALTAPEYRINDANTKLIEGANGSVRVQTSYGYTEIGPQNASYANFTTDRPAFGFSKPVEAATRLQVYATNTYLTGTEGKIAGNTVWHAGNDGSGSTLDADMVDGKHWSDIQSYIDAYSNVPAQSWQYDSGHGRTVVIKFTNHMVFIVGNLEYNSSFDTTYTLPFGIDECYSISVFGEDLNSNGDGDTDSATISGWSIACKEFYIWVTAGTPATLRIKQNKYNARLNNAFMIIAHSTN